MPTALNPKNAFEYLLRLEISPTGCVAERDFDIEIANIPSAKIFSAPCL